ncbi:trifunctional serine/threonine-protein kinase/ATP-binding protein/sensor histidine kinase [Bradyrhizobium erythrophlei]|uniref:histidine kinase n=1 Tax=Bradyrhizobium erythrophlei TaxID=1437360 RepID=A0A1H5A1N8_9BRAD|nr:trifunctional serine/threonine-protein kinase/ATP-binding protein/sensor histidine kinase [Bradyrhizobium erythrophlei]SED35510.1 PAS domain S-box-containing protein [Bradyrhizobium erythrophlei]
MELSSRFSANGIGGLEVLSADGGLVLCRGWRDRTGEREAVLIVLPDSEHPAPNALDRLAHEYSLKDELAGTWAVQPIELMQDRGQGILVLEDPSGELLGDLVGTPMEIERFLRVAIGLAAALGKAHQRGLVHKDVKPANILVNMESGEVRLTGFGSASRLPRERQQPDPPEMIAGTLCYMAPEQTGRMNRSIDSRSDLYSLGITFYEMLTGSLPFVASDPMEWVHCHIARQAHRPGERTSGIPEVVSSIVMKLLAKTAEERYQIAGGVEADLRRCLSGWLSDGRIDPFPLGAHDASDRLLLPEKLYGRENEIGALLAAFSRVAAGGRPELVLVSGYSGIGKSSVVNELHKSLVPPRALFASGKFDQYKRDIPYATLAQAFQSLIRPILAKNEEELSGWRDTIRDALGPNGQLMVELVPELKLIIGEQPPVPELPPRDAQQRFQLVFRRFIGAFTRKHPLALFLDDLQWLDAATLDLVEDLLTQPDVKYLLLIGAYRDNEVNPAHPLMRRLQAMRQAGAMLKNIVLSQLKSHDLEQFIVDSLHCDRERVTPLAGLVEEKTTGNPFFTIQFMSALFEEGLLAFDHVKGRWDWDLNRIHATGHTDNVVDLMVGKLSRLSIGAQKALQQLACLGNSADFAMLSLIYQGANEEMHSQLWEAVQTGFIFRSDDSYRFIHDRVQEAAYSLIPREKRAEEHLRIGMLMASHTSPEKLEECIFEIANQLNRGTHLISSIAEHERIAELNFIAGRRAKSSTAYASALYYLRAGRRFLTDETWDSNYDLIFSIEALIAECELLTADMSAAEDRLSKLAEKAKSAHDIALVARLRVTLYIILGSPRGTDVFIEYQRRLGEEWSPHPTDEEVRQAYDQVVSLLNARQIEQIVDLPLLTNPDVLDTLDMLAEVVMVASFTDANLYALVLCRMVGLSLEYGNSDASCFAYVSLGTVAGSRFGNYKVGFQLGKLGYDLVEKRGLLRYQARVYLRFGLCITPWTRHVNTGRSLIRRAFDAANRIGDLTFAAYSYNFLNTNLLAAGDPLEYVQREAESGLEFAKKTRFLRVADQITTQLALVRTLRGLTTKFGSFNEEHFDEVQFESHLSGNSTLLVPECWYWIRKLQARFSAGDYSSAIQASLNAERLLWSCNYYFEAAEHHFYSALARAGAFDSANQSSRQVHFKALTDYHRQLAVWAENCPENFENRAALVSAEIARIESRDLDAMHFYEQAIRSAHEHGFVQNEAVAHELAARFYSARRLETSADAHLRSARHCYLRWGADGKVSQLDRLYPRLAGLDEQYSAAAVNSAIRQLDVATVVKASQALSGEIELPSLIDRLMTIAIENAGADRGLLILPAGDEYLVQAEARATDARVEVSMRQGPITGSMCPESLVRYVIRTRESVILDDASKPGLFSGDDYLRDRRSTSILCLPLIKQGELAGILLLENTLTSHAFTPSRIAVLELLAAQAAISLENTRLYRDLQEREAKVRRLVDSNIIGIFIFDFDGRILEANDAFFRIVGYDRDDVRADRLSWRGLTPPEWTGADDRALAEVAATGTCRPYEKEFFRSDGSRVPVLMAGANFDELRHQGVAFALDLTERKQVEAELAHANRVATMGELTASIAHEVNQPLAALLTNAGTALRWLTRQPPVLEKAVPLIDHVIHDGRRAADIVDRIREFSKKEPQRKESLEINETILETVGLARAAIAEKAVAAKMQLADGLPYVLGDRVQLQQVILNLIMNAVEAMAEVGETSRELWIGTSRAGADGVLVAVSDSGPGLPQTERDRIFDAFYTTKRSGLGLGLSICRSIIDAHGGRIWAQPNTPRGTVFCFTVPTEVRVT